MMIVVEVNAFFFFVIALKVMFLEHLPGRGKYWNLPSTLLEFVVLKAALHVHVDNRRLLWKQTQGTCA